MLPTQFHHLVFSARCPLPLFGRRTHLTLLSENSKSEARNPKQIRITEIQMLQTENLDLLSIYSFEH
jgi:hypothetical protein